MEAQYAKVAAQRAQREQAEAPQVDYSGSKIRVDRGISAADKTDSLYEAPKRVELFGGRQHSLPADQQERYNKATENLEATEPANAAPEKPVFRGSVHDLKAIENL